MNSLIVKEVRRMINEFNLKTPFGHMQCKSRVNVCQHFFISLLLTHENFIPEN
jgi:hypothetical protein